MKKTLSLIASTLAFGILPFTQSVGAGQGQIASGPACPSPVNCRLQSTVAPQTHQQFMDATEGLRNELLVKRDVYFEIINSSTPDKEAAQQIWSEMFDLQTQIRAKAAELGVTPIGPSLGGQVPCNGMNTPRCNCRNAL